MQYKNKGRNTRGKEEYIGGGFVLGYKLLKILVTLKAKPQGRGVEKFGKILVEYKKQTSTKGAKVDPPRSI